MAKRRVPDEVRQFLVEMERGGGHIGRKSRSKTKVGIPRSRSGAYGESTARVNTP